MNSAYYGLFLGCSRTFSLVILVIYCPLDLLFLLTRSRSRADKSAARHRACISALTPPLILSVAASLIRRRFFSLFFSYRYQPPGFNRHPS
jgi:hypothetical protein